TVLTQSATQIGYNRTSWGTWTSTTNPTSVDWLQGDFNGDGKDDMAQLQAGSGCPLFVLLSTGTGFTKASWTIANCPITGATAQRFAVDVNGDGKDDIVVDAGHGDVHVAVSTGSGFTYQTWATSDGGSSTASWVPADANGDGKADFLESLIVSSGCKLSGLV